MQRNIALSAVIFLALGGCTTLGTTRAVATPWAAGGFHSFKPASVAQPTARHTNARVARLLDGEESEGGVRVAAR
ncbi:MAG: hypothetical protein ABI885_10615 [Gammaproteobacteria bacterium]